MLLLVDSAFHDDNDWRFLILFPIQDYTRGL